MKTKVARFVIPARALPYDPELEKFADRIAEAIDAFFVLRELKRKPIVH